MLFHGKPLAFMALAADKHLEMVADNRQEVAVLRHPV